MAVLTVAILAVGWSWPVLVYAAVVAVAFHLRVLLYEEPVLTKSFGDEYAAYKSRVPRWVIR